MRVQLVLTGLLVMLNAVCTATEEPPQELKSDRRAAIIAMSPTGQTESAEANGRAQETVDLKTTLQGRCVFDVQDFQADNLENKIVGWLNQSANASNILLCVRSEMATDGDAGLIAQGSLDGKQTRLDVAAIIRTAFQRRKKESSILLVFENYSAAAQTVLVERLSKLLNYPDSPDVAIAALIYPHESAQGIASKRACHALNDALRMGLDKFRKTSSGEILATAQFLRTEVARASQKPDDVQLIMSKGAINRGVGLPISPRRLDEAAVFLAGEISQQVHRAGIEVLGFVPPTVASTKKSTATGAELGCLLPVLHDQLLGHLLALRVNRSPSYEVVSQAEMSSILQACGVPQHQTFRVPSELFVPIENHVIKRHPDRATALLSVTLERDGIAGLRFRCGLYSQSPYNVGTIVESVPLTPADLPVVVESGKIQDAPPPAARTIHTPEGRKQNQAYLESVLAPKESQPSAKRPHELSLGTDQCPCRISLIVNDVPQPAQFTEGNTIAFNRLKTGDRVAIHVENWLPSRVFMRLLVDGKNTLPDRVGDKGVPGAARYVNLTSARAWLLEPAIGPNKPRINQVAGFYRHLTGDKQQDAKNAPTTKPEFETSTAIYNAFVVGNPIERTKHPESGIDESGTITVAFYMPVPRDKKQGHGTYLPLVGGPEKEDSVEIYKGDLGPSETSLLFYSLRYGN